MTTLREAAQEAEAALELMPCDCNGGCRVGEAPHWFECSRCKALTAIGAALALPPEPGWAEGAEAMREAAARAGGKAAAEWVLGAGRAAIDDCVASAIGALPVPPATTTPREERTPAEVCEALLGAVGVVGALEKKTNAEIGKLLLDHVWAHEEELGSGRELLLSEAISRLAPGLDPESPAPSSKPAESETGWIDPDDLQWFRMNGRPVTVYSTPGDSITRVRITVEPAPVEPEEAIVACKAHCYPDRGAWRWDGRALACACDDLDLGTTQRRKR